MGERAWPARALALAAFLAAPAHAGDWPAFRGGVASGVGEGSAPLEWAVSPPRNLRWRTPVPGLGHSSPVVWGEQVFVTSAESADAEAYAVGLSGELRSARDGGAYAWRVFALDRGSGEVRWTRTLAEGEPRSKRHVKNSFATPTPATDGRVLVVSFGSEGLFGLSLAGELLWRADLGPLRTGHHADPGLEWGYGSSPLLWGDLVIVQADLNAGSFLAAFDLSTGEQVWRTPRDEAPSWSTPVVYDGAPRSEVVTAAPRMVRGYDPATGRELWHLRWDQDIVLATPVVADGLIYAASGKGATQPIVALRPGVHGEVAWPAETADGPVVWARLRGGPIGPSPLAYGGCLYSLFDIGVLRCFSAASGELLYQERLPDSFLSSPVGADSKVYLTAESGEVYVVRAGPRFELLAVNSLSEPCVASPAVSDGMLVFRCLRHVFGVQEAGEGGAQAAGGPPGDG